MPEAGGVPYAILLIDGGGEIYGGKFNDRPPVHSAHTPTLT